MLLARCCFGQFGVVNQPMFSSASAAADNFATNLAHRFVATDLPSNNVTIVTWTDRITGTLTFGPWSNHVLTNGPFGLYFTAAGSAMTNLNGKTTALFNSNSTNWAMGAIIRLIAPDNQLRAWWGIGVNNRYDYQQPNGGTASPAPPTYLYQPTSGRIMNNVNSVGTNWLDVAWATTNGTFVHGITFINGAFWTNFGGNTGFTVPTTLGLFDFSGAGTAPETFGMRGQIMELWVRTNGLPSNQSVQFDNFAADLHYVRTNKYPYLQ